MVTPIIKYPLDLTGIHPGNLVLDEPHVINTTADRAFVPDHGPFYTRGLVVRMRGTGQVLQPHTDYKATQLFVDATLRTGMEVCSVIVAEPHITGEVAIDYQTVGGDYSSSVYSIEQMIASLDLDNRPVIWGGLLGKPEYFPPAPHLHDIGDLYGFEYLVVALEGIRKAILLGDVAAMDEIYRYVDAQDLAIWAKVNEIDGSLDSHLEDFANPHRVTKGQVGLGNVANYPVAQATDLLGIGSSTSYITPAQVRLMIDEHANLRNNPHQVTKAQIGLGLVENYAVATWADVEARANDKYLTPDMMAAYVDQALANAPEPATPPTARFAYTGATSVANNATHTLTFSDISTPGSTPITAWLWNFGDGTTSTVQAPPAKSYPFTVGSGGGSQTYTVSLSVTDGNNITKTFTQEITLTKAAVSLNPPTANITVTGTFNATDPAQPQLAFADASTPGSGTINYWSWDFGDGSVSTVQNPNKTYTLTSGQTKTYQVTLTVRDTNGLSATKITSVTVSRVSGVIPPTADIFHNVTPAGNEVRAPGKHYLQFNDISIPGSAAIVSWEWTITVPDVSQGSKVYTFTTRNTTTVEVDAPIGMTSYGAKLVVMDAAGESSQVTEGGDLYRLPAMVNGPTAKFSHSGSLVTTSPTNPSVQVSDTSIPGDAPITSWFWEPEANGGGIYSKTPGAFVYSGLTEGVDTTKTIRLTVTDANNQTDSTTRTFTVRKNPPAANQPPSAKFTFSVSGRTATFSSATSSDPDGSIASYLWDFGDGTTSSQANPSKTYPNTTASYSVTLTVTDNLGASNVATKTVSITKANAAPVAAWSVASQSNLTVNFSNNSSDPDGDPLTYSWDFGDGSSSTARAPSKTYAAGGSYNVSLTATDNSGAWNTASGNVTVSKPNAAPSANFTSTPNGLTVSFSDTSTDSDGTIVSRSWDFGDGGTSSQASPSRTYAAAGTYSVTLTVTDNLGASSSKSRSVTVSQPNRNPVAAFISPPQMYTGMSDFFNNRSTDPDGDALSAQWSWGDGTPDSTTWNASHKYTYTGSYDVTLTVYDGRGGWDQTTQAVYVSGQGGTGGVGCVVTSAIMYDGRTAAEFERRDPLLSTDPYDLTTGWQEVFSAETRLQPCVRIELVNGQTLECSTTAPIPTRDNGLQDAPTLEGQFVPYTTRDQIDAWEEGTTVPFEWVEVARIVDIGEQYVRYIFAQQRNFWVSMNGVGYILHHNAKDTGP